MDQKTRIRHLIKKYLDNTCTKSEMLEVLDIMKRAEEDFTVKQSFNEYWENLTEKNLDQKFSSRDADSWFDEVLRQAISNDIKLSGQSHRKLKFEIQKRHSNFHKTPQWIKVAAILLISFGFSLMYSTFQQEQDNITDVTVYEHKVAESGEKLRFMLPDGTQVHLNSESELVYSDSFSEQNRKVRLSGEAYFDVARDEERPFIVDTDEVTTEVLGTSFNIRSYPDDNEVIVAVTSGQVAVMEADNKSAAKNGGEEVVLKAGQWAGYTYDTSIFVTGEGDMSEYIAWNDGVLLHNDKKLSYVANQLERWYGVEIIFEHEGLKDCVIRGEYHNEILMNVLNAIGYAFDMDYRIEGRKVVLSGKGCE